MVMRNNLHSLPEWFGWFLIILGIFLIFPALTIMVESNNAEIWKSRLNNIGIDDFFNPESETYRQYKNLVPETGAVQMAEGGRAQFGDGTGTLDTPELLASDSDSDLIKSGKFARVVRLLMDEGFEFGEAVKEAMRQGYNSGGITSLNRENLNSGTMPKSERWMRDYFFSGKGGYDDRMSYQEFALGPGQELFKRFNKKNGGVMYGKYAKQILSS